MRFGMTEQQVRDAWGGALNGEPGDGCHYLNPAWEKAPSYFAFMFDGGKFVRYDVGNDREVAPGGGRRGMSEAQIDAAYPGRVAKSPHKYVDGGKYLRVKADDGSDGVLVFETDAGGKVTEWHAGLAPQVDWIEGCS
ncbi:MAG: lectin [Luteimonas sp.]